MLTNIDLEGILCICIRLLVQLAINSPTEVIFLRSYNDIQYASHLILKNTT